jgi:hypothetical protein
MRQPRGTAIPRLSSSRPPTELAAAKGDAGLALLGHRNKEVAAIARPLPDTAGIVLAAEKLLHGELPAELDAAGQILNGARPDDCSCGHRQKRKHGQACDDGCDHDSGFRHLESREVWSAGCLLTVDGAAANVLSPRNGLAVWDVKRPCRSVGWSCVR